MRGLRDWELGEAEKFFEWLRSASFQSVWADELRWTSSQDGLFSVKNYYNFLRGSGSVSLPWKAIWKSHFSQKVRFFCVDCSQTGHLVH